MLWSTHRHRAKSTLLFSCPNDKRGRASVCARKILLHITLHSACRGFDSMRFAALSLALLSFCYAAVPVAVYLDVPTYRQHTDFSCGDASLQMVPFLSLVSLVARACTDERTNHRCWPISTRITLYRNRSSPTWRARHPTRALCRWTFIV